MGLIKHEIALVGSRETKRILALFDTGAYRNYLRRELSDGVRFDSIGIVEYDGPRKVIMANQDITSGEAVKFKEVIVQGRNFSEPAFVIMDSLLEDAIIGAQLMQQLGISLDLPNERMSVR